MVSLGQSLTASITMSMASLGEGGSCGHSHVTSGWCCCTYCAMVRALFDWGEERNPCRYSKWVVGMVAVVLTK